MTSQPSVRVLGPADVGALRSLLAVFAHAFEDPESYLERQPSDPYLHELLGTERFLAIVAEAGTRLVGGLTGYVLPKFEQACREFYLYDLAVAHDHRRQGVATAFIKRLRPWLPSGALPGSSSRPIATMDPPSLSPPGWVSGRMGRTLTSPLPERVHETDGGGRQPRAWPCLCRGSGQRR
jgi:GNAT superfamily N-acetyltransferase